MLILFLASIQRLFGRHVMPLRLDGYMPARLLGWRSVLGAVAKLSLLASFSARLLICPKQALVNAVLQPFGRIGLSFGREDQLSQLGIWNYQPVKLIVFTGLFHAMRSVRRLIFLLICLKFMRRFLRGWQSGRG